MLARLETILRTSGDVGDVALWRGFAQSLEQGCRVAVLATTTAQAERFARAHAGPDHTLVPVACALAEEQALPLVALDTVLRCHAALWVTPVSAPLGARERSAMERLLSAGGPAEARVALADVEVLSQVSDHPEDELTEVLQRLSAVSPDGWAALPPDDLNTWLADLQRRRAELTEQRLLRIGRALLVQAQQRHATTLTQQAERLVRVEHALTNDDDALLAARREAERAAAHATASLRRRTEELVVDVRDFLHKLELDLPEQAAAISDARTLRRVLPHWLNHVLERYLADRLAEWRLALTDDLEHVLLAGAALAHAELLLPNVHPPPLARHGGWGRRIALSAALGGGAALCLAGLWVPGVLALGGGVAMGGLGQRDGDRDALLNQAIDALRAMGREAEKVVGDQLQGHEQELDQLSARHMSDRRDAGAQARAELEDGRAQLTDALGATQAQHDALGLHLRSLDQAAI